MQLREALVHALLRSTPMSARSRISSAIGVALLCALAAPASAQDTDMPGRAVVPRVRLELLRPAPNEAGVTFDENLWLALIHPFQSGRLSTVAGNVHRAPQSGLQFQLLTPGFAGITIHLRW